MNEYTFVPIFGAPLDSFEASNVFVMLPLREPFLDIYENHISSVAKELNLTCKHGAEFDSSERIMDEVWSGIFYSDVCIAECTGKNANVFYEIGVAHAIGKPCILIAQSADDIPFDVKDRRAIIYKYTPKGMRDFDKRLKQTLENIVSHSGGVVTLAGNLQMRVNRGQSQNEKYREADLRLLKRFWNSINTSNIVELNNQTQSRTLPTNHLDIFTYYRRDRRQRVELHFFNKNVETAFESFDSVFDAFYDQLFTSAGVDAHTKWWQPDYKQSTMKDPKILEFKQGEWEKTIDRLLELVEEHAKLTVFLRNEFPEFDFANDN